MTPAYAHGAITAAALAARLSDGGELALLDVREHGQYGEGHPFFAVPLPYSRFELDLPRLVPNSSVCLVLVDNDDGVAELACRRAATLGYTNVQRLGGGVEAWHRAGFSLFKGVNVPSKTFGEIVEHQRHTPRITATALQALRAAGEPVVIIDGRPVSEYRRMSIPGAICCPNGELALHIRDLVPDPTTRIVVNCAGRTRSIIGAQTLIDLGIPNPVHALENGTQGWFLAGLTLEHGAERTAPERPATVTETMVARSRALAAERGVGFVAADVVAGWIGERTRTTFLLDVRTEAEFSAGSAPGFVHAPGGQLVQATDQWVGVKAARIVLADSDGVRAPVVASWLRQLGHDAWVIEGGVDAARRLPARTVDLGLSQPRALPAITAAALAGALETGAAHVIDLRGSMIFRKGHIAGARWSIRPRVAAAGPADTGMPIILVADDPDIARLAAIDLGDAGYRDIRMLAEGAGDWSTARLNVVASPNDPPDADCIDYLFFVHDRHDGNAEAARQYLAWETGLLAQLADMERGVFRVAADGPG